MEGGERLDELADEVGGGGAPFAVGMGAAVPDGDFVDFDVLDCFGLGFHNFFEFLDQEHGGGAFGIVAARFDELLIAFGFGSEEFFDPFRFGFFHC